MRRNEPSMGSGGESVIPAASACLRITLPSGQCSWTRCVCGWVDSPAENASSPNRNQPELAIPGLLEELKKKVNRPVADLPLSEETQVVARQNGGSNGHGHAHALAPAITSFSATIAHFQLDAPTCPSCGHVAVRNGACYKCLNCGESLGCS